MATILSTAELEYKVNNFVRRKTVKFPRLTTVKSDLLQEADESRIPSGLIGWLSQVG